MFIISFMSVGPALSVHVSKGIFGYLVFVLAHFIVVRHVLRSLVEMVASEPPCLLF
jgi:hypothetical protein